MNFKKHLTTASKILFIYISLCFSSMASASFIIDLDFSNGGLSSSQQNIVSEATNFWNTKIIDYKDTVHPSIDGGFTVSVSGKAGELFSTLASASTRSIYDSFTGIIYSKGGSITFDTLDIGRLEDNGILLDVAKHEIAHIIGFGSLWKANGLYNHQSGEYTGSEGLAAYQDEFDILAPFVPVELEGGSGTANGHWNENRSGSGNTGITDKNGNDMRNELMTGWLNEPTFISKTTIASFSDLGYTVASVPVPTAFYLFISAISVLCLKRKF